ncbi:hypothetical protein [Pseudomonas pohangensis]|uniref:hypothetical protein n=1 Tax=Pseudomonas pohangensis TaxID=364197 RepID=UPI0038B53617
MDADRLDTLLGSLSEQQFPGKERLEAELARATIVDSRDVPPNTVTMNSVVVFRTGDGKEFSLQSNRNVTVITHSEDVVETFFQTIAQLHSVQRGELRAPI